MNMNISDLELLERALSLEKYAVSLLISLFENQLETNLPRRVAVMEALRKRPDRKHAVLLGLTGTPGSGKSSLLATCVPRLLELNKSLSIAVIAVDPSSPLSGGALLGDRTRMRPSPHDDRLFFRSQASQEQSGGLSPSTFQVCRLLACLFDCVFIETVGVGQSEADIRHLAEHVFLVLQPLGGDNVQFLKAGIMEIPHAFIVNKCDEPSAQSTYHMLSASLRLTRPGERTPVPVYRVSARSGEGIDNLCRVFLDLIESSQPADIFSKEAHFFSKWVQEEWGKAGGRFLEEQGGAQKYVTASGGFEASQRSFPQDLLARLAPRISMIKRLGGVK